MQHPPADAMLEEEGPAPDQALENGRLRPDFVAEVRESLEMDPERVTILVEQLHAADIADLIELIDGPDRLALAAALGERLDGDVVAELNDWVRLELMGRLRPELIAQVVNQLETDDAVALVQDLPPPQQQAVLRALEAPNRLALAEALAYPEDSAGRLMQREMIAVPEYWTIGQVIDGLQGDPHLTTEFYEIFVVDALYRPIGAIRPSWILRTPRSVPVAEVMQREQTLIPVTMDQEEVGLLFQKYALISAPVINAQGRLVGMITADDVVHVVRQEAQEDILRLAGAGDGDINEPVRDIVSARLRWLVVNCGTALLASLVISLFEVTLEKMVALAVLMPIVSALGGNAGSQAMAVAVRALAMRQLTASNTARVVFKELQVALINGFALAWIIGGVTSLYFDNLPLGLVIATAMQVNIVVAGLVGVLIPVTLARYKVDPAVASSIFVTMITDVMGFFTFLGLATLVGLADMGGA